MTPLTTEVICFGALLYVFKRLLNLFDSPAAPKLTYADSVFNRAILARCSVLHETYRPTLLWGYSGHIQTILYGKLGRFFVPSPRGVRHSVTLKDCSTVTFDVFEKLTPHPLGGDYTLVVCPGIANHSESLYIRTHVDFAQRCGYRVVVLNHLGSLPGERLTAPRIFTYGGYEEYAAMVDFVEETFTDTKMIAIGFSMGANIVLKYLGENPDKQKVFVAALSLCQGYDVLEIAPYLLSWRKLRRFYNWSITRHQKGVIRRNHAELFGEVSESLYGSFAVGNLYASTSLKDIDVHYTHRRAGFRSCEEYYHWASCRHSLDKIKLPVFLLNAADDPLIPMEILTIPRQFAVSRDNVIFAMTRHGGHLGFFENGLLIPDSTTWIDRVIVDYCNALLAVIEEKVSENENYAVKELRNGSALPKDQLVSS